MKGFVADFDISCLSVAALLVALGGSDVGSQLITIGKDYWDSIVSIGLEGKVRNGREERRPNA